MSEKKSWILSFGTRCLILGSAQAETTRQQKWLISENQHRHSNYGCRRGLTTQKELDRSMSSTLPNNRFPKFETTFCWNNMCSASLDSWHWSNMTMFGRYSFPSLVEDSNCVLKPQRFFRLPHVFGHLSGPTLSKSSDLSWIISFVVLGHTTRS